jgi:hypothetical protein
MEENMNLPDEIYIIVTEHDGDQNYPRPFIMETYVNESCSKVEVMKQVKRLGNCYGEVKIGRLVFDQDETLDLSDAMTPEEIAETTQT